MQSRATGPGPSNLERPSSGEAAWQEGSAISLTTRLLAAGTWKTRSLRTSTSMLVNVMCVDVVSASVSMVTSYLNNSSQTSHLLGDDNDRHRDFVILHAQHVSLTHVKNTLRLISAGSRDSKGCDSHESTAHAVHTAVRGLDMFRARVTPLFIVLGFMLEACHPDVRSRDVHRPRGHRPGSIL
ncbi:hypothetical protein HPB51_013201 [Rhipicephalus microplus]|uniref:Uncharacterized protein n=1 Tax=Rhipicephalus microplus TaxID=6941 RepID=A0A9J6DMZ2_RHIMP|nr:hypothetical protein HPB51_013201 [Rhipicephalus microplus]